MGMFQSHFRLLLFPVPSHALTHTLLKPDPEAALHAELWQGWQAGACLLKHAPPGPASYPPRARSGTPHPQDSTSQGPPAPWPVL